jgi:hypothetical protein
MSKKVRYEVIGQAFVNGSLVEPGGKKPVYVTADPGLEGKALKLAPEGAPQRSQQQQPTDKA